jgi:hypothetical protein
VVGWPLRLVFSVRLKSGRARGELGSSCVPQGKGGGDYVTAEEGAKGLLGYGGINGDGTVRHAVEDGSKGRQMMRDGGGSGVAIHEGIYPPAGPAGAAHARVGAVLSAERGACSAVPGDGWPEASLGTV